MQIEDPENPGKTKQLRLPYEAVMDLVKKLEEQGQSLKDLETMNKGALEQMANQLMEMEQAPQPQMPPQQLGY
jgi:hypothetical protein